MNDKVNPSAEPSTNLISVMTINPLLQDNVVDTMHYVSAVLEALEEVKISDAPSENYDFGMYLIHRWLRDTLRFANDHPKVEKVIPVIEEAQS